MTKKESDITDDIQSQKQAATPFISEEEMSHRLGIVEADLIDFEDVEIE